MFVSAAERLCLTRAAQNFREAARLAEMLAQSAPCEPSHAVDATLVAVQVAAHAALADLEDVG